MSTQIEQQKQQLAHTFTQQKNAFSEAPFSSFTERKTALLKLKKAVLNEQQALIDAVDEDYNGRSNQDTIIGDILPAISHFNYTLKKLKKWMKPQRRHVGLLLAPASVKVHYQPKGVIGIIVPWNFPIVLAFAPLVTSIAAGNRVMLKLSEFTPKTNQVIKQIVSNVFSEKQVAIIEGEADIAAEFSSLPFDHMLFTGSTGVGHHVMRAAAKNLTPVTLELGGKSPVIVAPDISIEIAVERLIYGKCLNAGQICVSPDYVLCPREKIQQFIEVYKRRFTEMYSSVSNNTDYGNIINQRQFDRLQGLLSDAQQKGATIISSSNETIADTSRKMPTQLVTNVTDDMLLMQDEIFGPILPIIGYSSINDAIEYINSRARPLALYLMSFDNNTQKTVLTHTHSGGVCVNDTILHVAADDAPFGGIGASGMGNYHGKEGFETFSHAKTVFSRGWVNTGKLVQPPYGKGLSKLMLKFFLR
ncbi:coniferyl aldehyde dehydrogenase [Parashewanella spongiae]|uniref:Aldehyde dehydrogenase n=1 Tax=Parashewanella spongiae TaxID=342950 RepID=A0A3A6TTY4_9GAMM|nr:coniferyl aldehyde dehydrogenase [Parashewanella spongiae]MCL1078129.1 coniferyl aldehyde dehydrogenase [Parashewanella spongiae]RJY16375.1 coniferyl aldehyde dehydrogenase [Parashewanella spongiae]